MTKKLIAFDLDDTLAVTKSAIDSEMSTLLKQLMQEFKVCIISGGNYPQFQKQVIELLPTDCELQNLHIMPTCGTKYYLYKNGNWEQQYNEKLPEDKKKEVIKILEEEAKAMGVWQTKTWGPIIEDRDSQITYSALGQKAPAEEKYKWADKYQKEKKELRDKVASRIPELEVRLGGSTSLDITKPGIDKAYGMNKLMDDLDIQKSDILFVGDKLEENGNDFPVKAMGIQCIAVEGHEDCKEVIKQILAKSENLPILP
jgi:HAD superfamily hydrolase (TIGR01484 family)